MRYSHDFIVIGSGIAGLTFALKISEFGSVALIAKDSLEEGATRYAQGGIASVMADDDSSDLHVSDTLEAGRGLCKEDVVRCIIKEGPGHVRDLIEQVLFTAPGERLNRPEFGTPLKDLVFEGASDALAATTEQMVHGALIRWLDSLISVDRVTVEVQDTTFLVTIVYALQGEDERHTEVFERSEGV